MSKKQLEKAWNEVPWNIVPLSFKVDFCQFIAQIKPAIRTKILEVQNIDYFLKSIINLGWHPIVDEKGFLVISRDNNLSKIIMEADQSPLPHAAYLGRLLGYPECCVNYIDKIGERGIDRAAEGYVKNNFRGSFSLIDISCYLNGIALISHVPCSLECQSSLNIALSVQSYIKINSNAKVFKKWACSVNQYFNPT